MGVSDQTATEPRDQVEPIVVVNHTVMSGQVARFYSSRRAVEYGHAIVSASRDGVVGHGGSITPEVFAAAWAAHERLKRREDVRDLETPGVRQ